jgi:hypothetical protein
MPKLHLKNLPTDRLALCKIWPGDDWVVKELAQEQPEGSVCRICAIVAAQTDPISPPES